MDPSTPWAVRRRLLDRAEELGLLPALARAFAGLRGDYTRLAALEWRVLERAVHEAAAGRLDHNRARALRTLTRSL
jgi:hypothetical protein